MGLTGRVGLRARLALSFVAVALLGAGVATLLADLGLEPRVNDAARTRLQRSATHMAEIAAEVYREDAGWRPAAIVTLGHLAEIDGLRVTLLGKSGKPVAGLRLAIGATASAPVVAGGRRVGSITVSQAGGTLLTPEEAHLRHSLDRLHLVAGALSVAAALGVAFLLAQTLARPLRRIRQTAQAMEHGELAARVRLTGDPEVRAVGHALNRLAETLEHEERLRKQSVADLAHELRTPVTGLLSRIEAAQDGVLSDERANLEAMHTEALRLARFLDDLSRLADAQRPGLLLDRCTVDLAEVARAEANAYAARFAAAGITLATELQPVLVSADPERLGQVVGNLLSNALRYTNGGGEVRLRVRRAGPEGVIEVTDTGIGIEPDDLRFIFKRFWRGEKSRSRATGGAGIGLAIADELVRAHDGRIDVESTPGRGSRFRVVLPTIGAGGREASHGKEPLGEGL